MSDACADLQRAMDSYNELLAAYEALRYEVERLRETNGRLNRRVQVMESKDYYQDCYRRAEHSERERAGDRADRELRKAMQKQGARNARLRAKVERLEALLSECAARIHDQIEGIGGDAEWLAYCDLLTKIHAILAATAPEPAE